MVARGHPDLVHRLLAFDPLVDNLAMLVDFAHRYGARARDDHQRFVDLFRNGRLPGV